MIPENASPEIVIGKIEFLKHGTHGTIQDQDPFLQCVMKCCEPLLCRRIFRCHHRPAFFFAECFASQ